MRRRAGTVGVGEHRGIAIRLNKETGKFKARDLEGEFADFKAACAAVDAALDTDISVPAIVFDSWQEADPVDVHIVGPLDSHSVRIKGADGEISRDSRSDLYQPTDANRKVMRAIMQNRRQRKLLEATHEKLLAALRHVEPADDE